VLADNGGLGLVEAAQEAADFWANKVRRGCLAVAGRVRSNVRRCGRGKCAFLRVSLTAHAAPLLPPPLRTACLQVRKESKDKSLPDWMAWANALRDSLKGLFDFVKVSF
jgi:hypothetical protein